MASSRHCGLLGLFLSTLVVGASAESIPIVYCAKVNTGTTSASTCSYHNVVFFLSPRVPPQPANIAQTQVYTSRKVSVTIFVSQIMHTL